MKQTRLQLLAQIAATTKHLNYQRNNTEQHRSEVMQRVTPVRIFLGLFIPLSLLLIWQKNKLKLIPQLLMSELFSLATVAVTNYIRKKI